MVLNQYGVDLKLDKVAEVQYRARRDGLGLHGESLRIRCVENAPMGPFPFRLRDRRGAEEIHPGWLKAHHRLNGPDEDARTISVDAETEYAAAVHEGARPHFIPGGLGFDPGVMHPGNRANPWMTRSVDEMAAENAP